MALSEQLAALEQELKRLLTADDAEVTKAVEQTRLPEWAVGASQEGYIAGTLLSVESACKLLRDRLAVPLELVCRIDCTSVQITGPLEDSSGIQPAQDE
jgi:hypothetical protein